MIVNMYIDLIMIEDSTSLVFVTLEKSFTMIFPLAVCIPKTKGDRTTEGINRMILPFCFNHQIEHI